MGMGNTTVVLCEWQRTREWLGENGNNDNTAFSISNPKHANNQSTNQFNRHNQTHKYKILRRTYRKLLYGVGGSTQGADAPLVRSTHVMKTNSTHMIVSLRIYTIGRKTDIEKEK